jgi:hypothetical protein
MPKILRKLLGSCLSHNSKKKKREEYEYYRFHDNVELKDIIDNYFSNNIIYIRYHETNNNYYVISNMSNFLLGTGPSVKMFKKRIMLENVENEKIDESNCCPICLENICKTEKIVKMNVCCHQFHKNCALSTLERKEECPICRSNIYDDIELIEGYKNKNRRDTYSESYDISYDDYY